MVVEEACLVRIFSGFLGRKYVFLAVVAVVSGFLGRKYVFLAVVAAVAAVDAAAVAMATAFASSVVAMDIVLWRRRSADSMFLEEW